MSRDGSSEYASAIKKGAPQARQVSDRWHLVKNLAACASVQLAQTLAQIRRAEQAKAKASAEEKHLSEEQRPARTRAVQQAQHARQAERRARYEQMMMLREQGLKSAGEEFADAAPDALIQCCIGGSARGSYFIL